MSIEYLTIPNPDFQPGSIIDSEEFDANNLAIRTKVNEMIDVVNTEHVDLTNDQSIDGVKTFTSSPVVPTPTANGEAANKEYIDGVATDFQMGEVLDGSLINDKLADDTLTSAKDTPEKRTLTVNKAYTSSTGPNTLTIDTDGTFDFTEDGATISIIPIANNDGLGGAIVVDSQSSKLRKKWDADTDSYVNLEPDDLQKNVKADFVWSVSNNFFILAPKGSGGNVAWLNQYDGINITLTDEKDKPVTVKAGEYVYNEFYETKAVGTALEPNPDYGTSINTSSIMDSVGATVEYNGYLYAVHSTNDSVVRYDLSAEAWDYWESSLSGLTLSQTGIALIGSKIYIQDSTTVLVTYDIDTDLWDTTLPYSTYSMTAGQMPSVGTKIYSRYSNTATQFVIYDSDIKAFGLTSAYTEIIGSYSAVVGDKVYVRQNASPYALIEYDTVGDTWTELTSSPSQYPLSYMCGDSDGKIWFYINSVGFLTYDTITGVWEEGLGVVSTYSLAYPTAVNSKIYVTNISVSPDVMYYYDDREEAILTQTFPPATQAASSADLLSTIAGTLEMSDPVADQVYQGFTSKVDLWDANMEDAFPQQDFISVSSNGAYSSETGTAGIGTADVTVVGSGWIFGVASGDAGTPDPVRLEVDGSTIPFHGVENEDIVYDFSGKVGTIPCLIRFEEGFSYTVLEPDKMISYALDDGSGLLKNSQPELWSSTGSGGTMTTRKTVVGSGYLTAISSSTRTQGFQAQLDGDYLLAGDKDLDPYKINGFWRFNEQLIIQTEGIGYDFLFNYTLD